MAIRIYRVGELYTADVTPPHGDGSTWSTDHPLPLDELIPCPRTLGCHPTDIGDALHEADREL